jgi:hypothetical protein
MNDPFNPKKWAEAFSANAVAAERNSLMDSGWSARTADNCRDRALHLYAQLFDELAKVQATPADFFDRPELAAVISAIGLAKAAFAASAAGGGR